MSIEEQYARVRLQHYWRPRCSMWIWFAYYCPPIWMPWRKAPNDR